MINWNDSAYLLPYVSYTKRYQKFKKVKGTSFTKVIDTSFTLFWLKIDAAGQAESDIFGARWNRHFHLFLQRFFYSASLLFCIGIAFLMQFLVNSVANDFDKKTCQLAADFQLLFSTRFSGFGSLHLFQFFMVGWKI